jgi:putative glutamine amidotransferase
MTYPLIGLTTSHITSQSNSTYVATPEAYIHAVAQAGGCPILIPVGINERTLNTLFPKLDGILFTGGGDIHPKYLGEKEIPELGRIDVERDEMEFFLLKQAVQENVPFLGICRGIQVINVGLGGTLYLDIPSQVPQALRHQCSPEFPRDYLAHEVQVSADSRLADILGEHTVKVNSMHHQAVRTLAPALRATGFSPDGLVEALELPDHPFGLAVQWHPECLTAHRPMRALFEAFVRAAIERRKD